MMHGVVLVVCPFALASEPRRGSLKNLHNTAAGRKPHRKADAHLP